MKKLQSVKLSFLTIVAAGVLVMLGSLALPTTQTFGLETDVDADANAGAGAPASSAPTTTAPSTSTAPSTALPPAAPVEGVGGNATALPSAGSGGYLGATNQSVIGFALVGLGIALVGSGTLVWAYGRKR